jgi:hypothetical protein
VLGERQTEGSAEGYRGDQVFKETRLGYVKEITAALASKGFDGLKPAFGVSPAFVAVSAGG